MSVADQRVPPRQTARQGVVIMSVADQRLDAAFLDGLRPRLDSV